MLCFLYVKLTLAIKVAKFSMQTETNAFKTCTKIKIIYVVSDLFSQKLIINFDGNISSKIFLCSIYMNPIFMHI